MKTAGDLVSASAELASCVKDRKHNLQSAFSRLFLNIHRDTAPVVRDPDNVSRLYNHVDVGAVTGKRLVDGVVDNFIYKMMQA